MGESSDPLYYFRNRYYHRLNDRRLEHLASLGLDLAGKRVLEVGAGIGDLTHFFLDRGCEVTITDAREDNLAVAAERYRGERVETALLDLDDPPEAGAWRGGLSDARGFDVVFCFGLLYHLIRPGEAIAWLAEQAGERGVLLLETVCALGEHEAVNLVDESMTRCSQSLRGQGCRPTRAWVLSQMREGFGHSALLKTQPWHDEFPIAWPDRGPSDRMEDLRLGRCLFVAWRGDGLEGSRLCVDEVGSGQTAGRQWRV